MMTEIQNVARMVAELEAAATTAANELTATRRHADSIRNRRAMLVAERDSIAAARRAGGYVDGARLAVIGLDIEGLDALLAEATAAIGAVQAKADAASIAADGAREHLDLVKNRDLLARLTPHATALAAKLAETMGAIKAAEAQLKLSRPSWAPPKAFANEIRKLDLVADGIPGIRQ
jgi:hypothetical protein